MSRFDGLVMIELALRRQFIGELHVWEPKPDELTVAVGDVEVHGQRFEHPAYMTTSEFRGYVAELANKLKDAGAR